MILLELIGALFIFVVITILIVGFSFFVRIFRSIRMFRDAFNGNNGYDTSKEKRNATTNRASKKRNGVVYDSRSDEEIEQKIFSKDEGEYVKYTEIKE